MVMIFFGAAVLGPMCWVIRNRVALDRWTPLTTGSGTVFAGAHCEATAWGAPACGGWSAQGIRLTPEEAAMATGHERPAVECVTDSLLWSRGLSWLGSQSPMQKAGLLAMKWARVLSPSTCFRPTSPWTVVAKGILVTANLFILAACLLWIARRQPMWWVGALLLASLLVTSGIFWGGIRLRYVIQPVIAAFAGCQLASLGRGRGDLSRSSAC